MRLPISLVAAAAATVLVLTGCTASDTAAPTPVESETPTAVTPTTDFISNGVYEFEYSEMSFASADGSATLPVTAKGRIMFKDGECAMDIIGYDISGTEINIVKELGKNGYVRDSVSNSWTEMGSPYVPSIASAYPGIVAFNRAAGEFNSFCALAALGRVSDVSESDTSLYTTNSKESSWIAENIATYAAGVADAAELTGDARSDAIARVIRNNSFGDMPQLQFMVYDVAGFVTIEDATESGAFRITLIRQNEEAMNTYKPMLPADAPVTTAAELAQGYIDSLQ